MLGLVNEKGRDDHHSFDYLLVVGRNTEKVESVVKKPNDKTASQGERDAADSAGETGAADHHGCNRIQLVRDTCLRKGSGRARWLGQRPPHERPLPFRRQAAGTSWVRVQPP